jgi:signal transduction histidine kinase
VIDTATKPQQVSSLRRLLHLEWLLLALAGLQQILPVPMSFSPFHWQELIIIISFGLIGLKLPKTNIAAKISYVGLEFGLIWLPGILAHSPIMPSPIFYIIIVIRSCIMFRLPGQLIIAGLSLASFFCFFFITFQQGNFGAAVMVAPPSGNMPSPAMVVPGQMNHIFITLILQLVLSFTLVIVFILMLVNALLSEHQSRKQLIISHDRLRHYALRIEDQATLQERNRIAREIHDALGHTLTAQSLQLDNSILLWQSDGDKAKLFLVEAKRLGTQALSEVRQSIATLRSDPFQGQSFAMAIDRLIHNFQQTTGIQPVFTFRLSEPLPMEVQTALYRIIQEALMNVTKHSQAKHVIIKLQAQAGLLDLLIDDNGQGFNPLQNTTGFGLQGMRERTHVLGGQFQIISARGAGCKAMVRIPLVPVGL